MNGGVYQWYRWWQEAEKHAEGLADLLLDVAASGVQLDDPRMGYVVVQVDRGVWDALQAGRSAEADRFN